MEDSVLIQLLPALRKTGSLPYVEPDMKKIPQNTWDAVPKDVWIFVGPSLTSSMLLEQIAITNNKLKLERKGYKVHLVT